MLLLWQAPKSLIIECVGYLHAYPGGVYSMYSLNGTIWASRTCDRVTGRVYQVASRLCLFYPIRCGLRVSQPRPIHRHVILYTDVMGAIRRNRTPHFAPAILKYRDSCAQARIAVPSRERMYVRIAIRIPVPLACRATVGLLRPVVEGFSITYRTDSSQGVSDVLVGLQAAMQSSGANVGRPRRFVAGHVR
jgi:hypothetical protein